MSGAVDPHFDLFIAGQSVPGSRSEPKVLLNPADNRPLTTVADGTAGDATHAMEAAYKAFRESGWAGDDGAKRGRTLWKLAKLLEEQAEGFALLETLNMGKTLKESRFDVGYVVRTLEYFAGLADKVHGETIPVPGPRFDYTLREPLGVTVHIAPWNYPLLLSIRSVAPALAAGNAVVLKPASLTPLTALKFARLAKDAGVPDGILNVVTGPGAELAAARFIPTTLELGGKSPVVVLPDADLDRAAKGIATGIFSNAGQMCWAGSRLVVHETIKDELVRKVSDIAAGYRLGPGTEPTSDVGPLVSREQEARVTEFIQEARAAGGRIAIGGGRPEDPTLSAGNFVRPTVVVDVEPSQRIVRDEVFGPVLSVLSFRTPEEAIRIANETRYGLFAMLWTKELSAAHMLARQLEAGVVMVNESPNTYPQTPFGGFKESGLGFEQGMDAVAGFTRRKNVMLNLGQGRPKRA